MAKEPIKIDASLVPPAAAQESKPTVAGNAAFAKDVAAEFDSLKKSMKLDPKEVPARASVLELPTRRYHVGCIPGSPHNCMYVGNVDFPLISSVTYPGSAKDRPATVIECMGAIKEFTDEQVKALVKASSRQSWKFQGKPGEVNPSRRWKSVDLNEPKAVFEPGAKLLASFIYIRPLEDGEQLVPGVKSLDGKYLAVPETLYPDPTAVPVAA